MVAIQRWDECDDKDEDSWLVVAVEDSENERKRAQTSF